MNKMNKSPNQTAGDIQTYDFDFYHLFSNQSVLFSRYAMYKEFIYVQCCIDIAK